jgi:uncharacterized protein YciI
VPARFLVEQQHGPDYDPARRLREQTGWDRHAAFMDALLAEGFVLLGGPVGEEDGAVLVVQADDAQTVRERLSADPWHEGILHLASIRPWALWLGELPGR